MTNKNLGAQAGAGKLRQTVFVTTSQLRAGTMLANRKLSDMC